MIYINKQKRFQRPTKTQLTEVVKAIIVSEKADIAEMSLTYIDNTYIQELNRDYLNKDRPTDVIAFTLSEEGQTLIGDVYISIEQARIQAVDFEVSPQNELIRLTTHGVLHVLGYDHETDEDAKQMKRIENHWVDYFGAKFDYN